MLKKVFGAALVALFLGSVAASAATLQVTDLTAGLTEGFATDGFLVVNGETDAAPGDEVTESFTFTVTDGAAANQWVRFTIDSDFAQLGSAIALSIDGVEELSQCCGVEAAGNFLLAVGTDYVISLTGTFQSLSFSASAVPLPAAAWLFLSVLAGAGFMRRKGVAKA